MAESEWCLLLIQQVLQGEIETEHIEQWIIHNAILEVYITIYKSKEKLKKKERGD